MLQELHRDVYAELGEPSLIANNNISNSARLVWFLISGGYRQVATPLTGVVVGLALYFFVPKVRR